MADKYIGTRKAADFQTQLSHSDLASTPAKDPTCRESSESHAYKSEQL